ncbi:MAG: hypothetical protein M3Y17_13700 [Actinomycetota bacterium]|nr:hypothetical protein [Actinomycetota bacterium]
MSAPVSVGGRSYRVVVYEHDHQNGCQNMIMDATATGLIAAIATIANGTMDAQVADGGPRDLQAHIALLIAQHHGA